MKGKELMTHILLGMIGTPYEWAGNDPRGVDCSGFIIWAGKKTHLFQDDYDNTAQGLYNRYKDKEVDVPEEGCFVFYGKDKEHITHITYALNHSVCIGAIGGSRMVNSRNAYQNNAYVKIENIYYRDDIVAIVNPFQI